MFCAFSSKINNNTQFQDEAWGLKSYIRFVLLIKSRNSVAIKHKETLLHLVYTKCQQKLNSKLKTSITLFVKLNGK